MSLTDAKNLLKKLSVSEEEIKQLSRWKMIDAVRKLCTEKAKTHQKEITKYSRGKRYSILESQQKR